MKDADTVTEVRSIIGEQTRQIDRILHSLRLHRDRVETLPAGDARVIEVILPLILAAGSSGHSLLSLTKDVDLSVRDGFGIARSITETVTNALYFMASGPELAERAFRHATQRAVRYAKQEWLIGDEKVRPFADLANHEDPQGEIADLLAEFTSKKGREISWISESVEQRIAFIEQNLSRKVAVSLRASFYMIYRESSEILHGSLYGILFFLGATLPGSDDKVARGRTAIDAHRLTLLMATVLAFSALAEGVGIYTKWAEASDFAKRVLENLKPSLKCVRHTKRCKAFYHSICRLFYKRPSSWR